MNGQAPKAHVVRLPELPVGWELQAYALLSDGTLGLLGIGGGDVAGVRLWAFDGEKLIAGPRKLCILACPHFDRFPDGRWLVASVRGDGPDGHILDVSGQEVRRIRLGDGIMHVKVDTGGRIWVGWFDEGVFGNSDWKIPGREWPPSAHGLAAFDEFGNVIDAADQGPHNGIADCYSLNVIGKTAWACTYADFPILAFVPGEPVRWWTTGLSGTRALAVDPPYVLAAGGYGENGNRLTLLKLGAKEAATIGEWRLPFQAGYPDRVALVDARGDTLSIVNNGEWHRWRVQDSLNWPGQHSIARR